MARYTVNTVKEALDRGPILPVGLLFVTAVLEFLLLMTSNRVVDTFAGLPLLLLLPGFSLFLAVNPTPKGAFSGEWLMWAVSASLGIAVLGGLVLNVLGGLTRLHWLAYIAAVVGLFSAVSLFRASESAEPAGAVLNGKLHSDEVSGANCDRPTVRRMVYPRPRAILTLVFALLLVIGSLTLAQLSTSATRERFAQLWLIPTSSHGGAQAVSAELGVQNFEGRSEEFDVALYQLGSSNPTSTWSVFLQNEGQWAVTISRPSETGLRATLRVGSGLRGHLQFVSLQAPGP